MVLQSIPMLVKLRLSLSNFSGVSLLRIPLTRRKISSFRSTMSCKNWGAIHLDDAFVLTLTEETGGDCR